MGIEILMTQFGYNEYALRTNTADMNHQQSCIQPAPAGNCINWIVGHILSTRNKVLQLVDQKPIWSSDEAGWYATGSKPIVDPESALPFDRMFKDLATSQTRIMEGLRKIGAEGLAKNVPPEMAGDKKVTVGNYLAGLAFHEAYHAGQTGIIRRLVGKDGAIG